MQKEELISALTVRMVWKRNIVRLGTRIVIIHISNKHANLHWTIIHIARCVCKRCQIMDTYENVYTVRKLKQFQIKKCLTEWILGEIILTLMFWKYFCIILLIEMDPLMTILMSYWTNTRIMIARVRCTKNQGNFLRVDCEVTIFTCRNSKYHGTFAMFYKLDTLTLAITNITDRLSWASALFDPNIIFFSNGLSVFSNL